MATNPLSQKSYFDSSVCVTVAADVSQDPILAKQVIAGDGRVLDLSLFVAESDWLLNSSCDLINRRYSWRGYGGSHHLHSSANKATFSAMVDDAIVGTVSLTVDGRGGLAADAIFREEIDRYRAVEGAHVCEMTKLAVDSDIQSQSILAAMFHTVLLFGQIHYACTDLFIEVNPRHRRFYEAMLGFKRVGELRMNRSVSAPSQLMHLAVSDIRVLVDAYRGMEPRANSRSLYPWFLSQEEERVVLDRLLSRRGRSDRPSEPRTGYPLAQADNDIGPLGMHRQGKRASPN